MKHQAVTWCCLVMCLQHIQSRVCVKYWHEFWGVNIFQKCTIGILNGLYLGYYLSNVSFSVQVTIVLLTLIDWNIDNQNMLSFGVLTPPPPHLVAKEQRPYCLKKEMICQIFDPRQIWFLHQKVPQDMNFQSSRGFHYQFMALSTSPFTIAPCSSEWPPPQLSSAPVGKRINTVSMTLKISGFSYLTIYIYHHTQKNPAHAAVHISRVGME